VNAQQLKEARPYVIVLAFIMGMLLAPPDVLSQVLLAVPIWILYETGIIVGQYFVSTYKRTVSYDSVEEEP